MTYWQILGSVGIGLAICVGLFAVEFPIIILIMRRPRLGIPVAIVAFILMFAVGFPLLVEATS